MQEINNNNNNSHLPLLCVPKTSCVPRRQGELARRCRGLNSIGSQKFMQEMMYKYTIKMLISAIRLHLQSSLFQYPPYFKILFETPTLPDPRTLNTFQIRFPLYLFNSIQQGLPIIIKIKIGNTPNKFHNKFRSIATFTVILINIKDNNKKIR
uniref:Uncharacterized protein n=1 Tax=Cacopsylla melanoneura TaxID=428564 RepID=A0A8D9AG58_9HEMI